MKPMGFRKLYKESNDLDAAPPKSIKKWKRGEKQMVKKQIKKELNYDVIDDFEKEYQLRKEQEEYD